LPIPTRQLCSGNQRHRVGTHSAITRTRRLSCSTKTQNSIGKTFFFRITSPIDCEPFQKCLVNEAGFYNEEAPTWLQAKNVLNDGSRLILDYLPKADIIGCSKFTHSYPIDWRTKEPVLFRASAQWFINTDKLKEQAIAEIQKVEIFPKQSAGTNKDTLTGQLAKRPYWCISRQRVWGVPIPVFYDKVNSREIINE
jgi:isoleucyl-tRNA synthetase